MPRSEWSGQVGFPPRYTLHVQTQSLEEMEEAPRKRNEDDETYHDKLCIIMAILLSAIASYLISTPRESV